MPTRCSSPARSRRAGLPAPDGIRIVDEAAEVLQHLPGLQVADRRRDIERVGVHLGRNAACQQPSRGRHCQPAAHRDNSMLRQAAQRTHDHVIGTGGSDGNAGPQRLPCATGSMKTL